MRTLAKAAAILGLLSAGCLNGLGAQVVHGTVVDGTGQPVPGVVVLLVDAAAASTPVARALTNESGAFRMSGPRAGMFRLRTLRIGFRPVLSDPFALAEGQDRNERIELASVPVALDTIRVSSRSQCRTVGDSASATFRVWEQVRSALMATSITAGARVVNATTIEYRRTLDLRDRITDQSSNVRSDYVTQPWSAVSQDSLHRDGYVTTESNGWITFYAPGIETLLSDGFLADHCFRLVNGGNQLGVMFEPGSDRGRIAEVRGTLWLDRASAELRSLEFQYVNIAKEQSDRSRGRLTFARASNGVWLLSGWHIEMPVLARKVHEPVTLSTTGRAGTFTPGYVETVVSEVQVRGGELISARRGNDTLWLGPRWRLTGIVSDTVSDAPITGARVHLAGTNLSATTDESGQFAIERVLPGAYTLEVRTASLDRVGAVNRRPLVFADSASLRLHVPSGELAITTACKSMPDLPGIISGEVTVLGDAAPTANRDVEARWKRPRLRMEPGYALVAWTEHSAQTRTDSTGHFVICGVPRDESVSVTVVGDPASLTNVSIPLDNRFVWVSLTLHPAPKPSPR